MQTHPANREGTGKASLSMKYVDLVTAKARAEGCEFVTLLRVTHHDRLGDGLNWIRKGEKITIIPSFPPTHYNVRIIFIDTEEERGGSFWVCSD